MHSLSVWLGGKKFFSVFLFWPFKIEATFQRATIEKYYGQGDDSPLKLYLPLTGNA
jgi:hypothetical protein